MKLIDSIRSRWPGSLPVATGFLVVSWVALGRRFAISGEGLHEGLCYLMAITVLSTFLVERQRRRTAKEQATATRYQTDAIRANTAAIVEYTAAVTLYTTELQIAHGGNVTPLQPRFPQ